MLVEYTTNQIIPLPDLWLYHDVKSARRFLASNGEDPALVDDDVEGQCICVAGSKRPYCVVVLTCDFSHHAQTCGVIAHESYHATCFALDQIGETEAGEETMAYVLQAITASLVCAHCDYVCDVMEEEVEGDKRDGKS